MRDKTMRDKTMRDKTMRNEPITTAGSIAMFLLYSMRVLSGAWAADSAGELEAHSGIPP
jgi:hypothetical protein